MPLRRPTKAELERWDELVASSPAGGCMWQFQAYQGLKQPEWQPVYAVHELADGTRVYASYLERLVPGFGAYWYASMGPRVSTVEQLAEVCEQLRGLKRPFAVLMESPIEVTSQADSDDIPRRIPGLCPGPPLQPANIHTVEIDLTKPEEELLASFKQRTRRYIRKNASARVEIVTDDSRFDEFWRLYEAMLGRSQVDVRPREYYELFWRYYLNLGQGYFVFGTPEGEDEPTAGAFCILNQDVALYKDGGSVRDKDSNGLQYRVQWEAMRHAKQCGARTYDMLGAPPSWQADDPAHGFHGLVQFKTGFAPIKDYAGAFTLATRPQLAKLWDKAGYRAYTAYLWKRHHQYFA